jgi:hypothetical protein
MKFSLEVEIEGNKNGEEKKSAPTAFQKKVAKILAQKSGRSKPNKMDYEKAAELEDEDD